MLPPQNGRKGEGVTELGGRNLLSLLYLLPAMNNQEPLQYFCRDSSFSDKRMAQQNYGKGSIRTFASPLESSKKRPLVLLLVLRMQGLDQSV